MHRSVLLLTILFLAPATFADQWSEREALARLSAEVTALEQLARDAASLSDADARVRFDYLQLLSDLGAVRQGIQKHLTQPIDPVMPARIDPLAADYTASR